MKKVKIIQKKYINEDYHKLFKKVTLIYEKNIYLKFISYIIFIYYYKKEWFFLIQIYINILIMHFIY
jgi:hypothetical protein